MTCSQIEASPSAHEAEMRRLEGESETRQAALAHLQATCGQQTAALSQLEKERNQERARRWTPPPRPQPGFPPLRSHSPMGSAAVEEHPAMNLERL